MKKINECDDIAGGITAAVELTSGIVQALKQH
jgi:hypothetical protein